MRWLLFFSYLLGAISPCLAQNTLPLPRFVSLKAKAVNVHYGPGLNYPVSWQLRRQYMPVEVIADFENWRKIRDVHGQQGWVHKSLLSSTRYVIVLSPTAPSTEVQKLLKEAKEGAEVIASMESGVIGKISYCQAGWCRLSIQKHAGWISRASLWGVYPHEMKF